MIKLLDIFPIICYNTFCKTNFNFREENIMPLSAYLIIGLIGGLVLTVLLKLLFNKITGKHGIDFADFMEFFIMWLVCSVIVIVIMFLITLESHM